MATPEYLSTPQVGSPFPTRGLPALLTDLGLCRPGALVHVVRKKSPSQCSPWVYPAVHGDEELWKLLLIVMEGFSC